MCELVLLLGPNMAGGGNGTGADETAWQQSKPVHTTTFSPPVRTLLGTMFAVQVLESKG